jgi:CheY-like chemotaxis protein
VNEHKIMVVDDDPHSREIVRAYLESRGYSVVTAKQGEEAIALLAEVQPAIVLLDVMMPGMDGWEVARMIRSHPACSETRVIMLTARSDYVDEAEQLRAGAHDYLVKPVRLEDLAGYVQRNLAARERDS